MPPTVFSTGASRPTSPTRSAGNLWTDTLTGSFTGEKTYVVQTNPKVVERCLLMTSDPGDLVFDPTCGSGTTAWCAEKWGRRWITCDTSRVPIALARQRLLTGTFDYHRLKEPDRGPAGGFEYQRKQNRKGEEIGGIAPRITLQSIARDEPPKEEVLVDRPEKESDVTRVSGPFCVEATIPAPIDWEGDGEEDSGDAAAVAAHVDHVNRMIEVLRRVRVLHLAGGQKIELAAVRPPARTLSLSAEAMVEGAEDRPVAIVFGPENGAVSEAMVFEAAKGGLRKGIQPPVRDRLRHPAGRATLGRGLRASRGSTGDVRTGEHGPDHEGSAEEPPVEPDLLRVRPARRANQEGKEE